MISSFTDELERSSFMCEAMMTNLMKSEKLMEKQQNSIHSYCDEENSRSENPPSLKIAGAVITRQLIQKCLRRDLSCSLEDL